MATGKIKDLHPPGNNGSRHGSGSITEDVTGRKFKFHTPRDVDPADVPLTNGDSVIFDITNGNKISNLKKVVAGITCSLAVNLPIINLGGSIILSWASANADTLTINQGIGNVSPVSRGSVNHTPSAAGTITYILTATNLAGQSATSSVDVNVT